MTLSACDTAMGGAKATGREIEGFGALAQRKGAKAVLATLWPVMDRSTGIFMQNLYRLRQEKNLSKAEALQEAQLLFIRGQVGSEKTHEKSQRGEGAEAEKKAFIPDSEAPYAHPYYWAPFILMGNWL